jgi:predicted transcriptional regulator
MTYEWLPNGIKQVEEDSITIEGFIKKNYYLLNMYEFSRKCEIPKSAIYNFFQGVKPLPKKHDISFKSKLSELREDLNRMRL